MSIEALPEGLGVLTKDQLVEFSRDNGYDRRRGTRFAKRVWHELLMDDTFTLRPDEKIFASDFKAIDLDALDRNMDENSARFYDCIGEGTELVKDYIYERTNFLFGVELKEGV